MRGLDLTAVPPQGGYVARRCPVRVQNDVLRPETPREPGLDVQRRLDHGVAFEATAISNLESLGVAGRVVDNAEGDELDADAEGNVAVLIAPRLPTDIAGRRRGRPDLLVVAAEGGFRAVDIKHHMVLDAARGEAVRAPALISTLERPALEDAAPDQRFAARRRIEDLLQLGHYQRMLEASGLAAPGGRWAGVLGTDGRIVWYDLDVPMWKERGSGHAMQSTMERYDDEFALRLDIIATALAHQENPSVPLLAFPVRIRECDECPWWNYCRQRIEAGSGDVTLLPRVGWRERNIHQAHGVVDRAALARLDPRTARLVAAGIDVPEFQRLVDGLEDDTPISDLGVVVRAKTQLARLESEGVATFGDLMRLDPVTASYAGCGMSSLADQIDLARAALGPEPIYRRRGVKRIDVPRADVEVDVDMENIEEGVYLWGALRSVRGRADVGSEYLGFVTWDPLTAGGETENFRSFWTWLQESRAAAHRSGHSFKAYCYNASAENTYLKKLGLALGVLDDVMAFIQSEEWVDLLRVVDDHLVTGRGSGLKAIAPLAGHSWDIDDPGGGLSMVKYDVAADPQESAERQRAREWLMTYNRGDVQATLTIRDWLESSASALPSVADVIPPSRPAVPVSVT